MLFFVFIASYLYYRSVFLGLARLGGPKTMAVKQAEPAPEKPKRVHRRIAQVSKNPNGKLEMQPLTRKRFDDYMRTEKPYLDGNFRMTDLEEALNANRTVISNFVNRTYGVNFNRYVNHLRIMEVRRLQKLPSSDRYALVDLVRKAGFNVLRSYTRALAVENEKSQNKEEKP